MSSARTHRRSFFTLKRAIGLGAAAALALLVVLPRALARRPEPDGPTALTAPLPQREALLAVRAFGMLTGDVAAEVLPPRDRIVQIYNVNTTETAVLNIGPGGYVRSDQMVLVDRFFRCRRTDRHNRIDPSVLELLADISEHWPGRVIEILSGFRAPPYGAPKSRHFVGNAIDLRVRGVSTTAVRDFVWREHRGGVGYYAHSNFVHVDARGADDAIAWSAHAEEAPLEYHPRWSKRQAHQHAQ